MGQIRERSRVFGTYWSLVAAQGSISMQSPEEEENERQMQELDRDLSRRVECPLLNCPREGSPYPLPVTTAKFGAKQGQEPFESSKTNQKQAFSRRK